MKKILLIATGGTIASAETDEGLAPALDAEQILAYVPGMKGLCKLSCRSIMSVDSTNMNPKRMVKIAEAVREYYGEYDGFVITHGTDTMGYTAAALTYMLQNIKKPVVITGSQVAMEEPYTDAKQNLSDAIRFACEKIRGVFVLFDGTLINGTHAVKVKTRSPDAFASINFPPVAYIKHGKITYNKALTYSRQWEGFKAEPSQPFQVKTDLCENILILKMFPGIRPEVFDFIKGHCRGVVLESFGIGGIPNEDYDIVSQVQELVQAGTAVAITTQCLREGIDLDIYAVGKRLAKQKIIDAADMTTEALTMKLMWALGNCSGPAAVKEFIETPFFADRSY